MTLFSPLYYLENILKAAFLEAGFSESYARVSPSDRPDLADYQSNGAFLAAKDLKSNPRDVADKIMTHLSGLKGYAQVSLAGPGFLNFKMEPGALAQYLNHWTPQLISPTAAQRVIIDYGGPNVAKPMHVGHLRSTIIGDSLKRLFRFMGHTVIGDIHLGDWGTQMGMLIIEMEKRYPLLPYFDPSFTGPYPDQSPCTLNDLQEMYPLISQQCKEDPTIAEKARLATMALQQGRPGYRALWQHFVDVSLQDMKIQFERLDVTFDQWFGESRYQDQIPSLLADLSAKGIAQESQGALVIPVTEPTDKIEIPPLMMQKTDGGYLYGTSDMATLQERIKTFEANLIIYVVDGRQGLHFEQVFRAARKCGWTAQTEFIGFGTMNGPDNKPFKTRAGGVMRLEDLMNQLDTEAAGKMRDAGFTADNAHTVAHQIGMAALKFADLQHDPVQNYQFDMQKFMQFEGKTGPYLLYAAVRIKSILSKAKDEGLEAGNCLEPSDHPAEIALALMLGRYEEYIRRAYEKRGPNILCEFAFELAQTFSRFYTQCPILKEPEKAPLRLKYCELALKHLEITLGLLGIQIPDKM